MGILSNENCDICLLVTYSHLFSFMRHIFLFDYCEIVTVQEVYPITCDKYIPRKCTSSSNYYKKIHVKVAYQLYYTVILTQ